MSANLKIVILGGGFAGAYCAQALERSLRGRDATIHLIDRNNYFVFYPFLVEAGTGSLEPRHAVISIRAFLRSTVFRMAEVTDVDTAAQAVILQAEDTDAPEVVRYDHLVVALGSVTHLPAVRGLRAYGFEMKSLTDAIALRDRAIQLLERADATPDADRRRALLHFVVVGGNFSGVEVAGEFDVFLREASRYYRNVHAGECAVTLVERADRILSALDRDLSDYAVTHMQRRGIRIRLHATVQQLDPEQAVLSSGEVLPTHTVVWCAGIAPNPLIANLPFPVDTRGYVLCQRDLRVDGFHNVWAIGDCAVNTDREGNPYPATAQHAVGQAQHLARNLVSVLEGRSAVPCHIRSRGALAGLGCRTAVAKLFGLKLAGFPAWLVWRTVYLLKMPGWARRVRVALDWAMNRLFPRDYVETGVHTIRQRTSAGPTVQLETTASSQDRRLPESGRHA